MTVFATIIDKLALTPTSQGKFGEWYLLFKSLDAYEEAAPTGDTFANPYRECLRRLYALVGDTPAYRALASEFGTLAV
jgi:hypothetical protein